MAAEDFNGQLLLVEIHTKLKGLIDRFDIVSQGDGFPRCVNRDGRIKRLEQDVIAMKKEKADAADLVPLQTDLSAMKKRKADFDTWLMRLTWAAILLGMIKMAFFPGGLPE